MSRLTFDEFIAHTVLLKRVIDTAMRSAICSYVTYKYKALYESKPYAAKEGVSRLVDVFKEIALDNLTLETLSSLESIIEDNKHRKEVCRFLIFACKANLILDARINRLCDFEEFFEKGAVQMGFPFYIMRDPNYAVFKASDIYENRSARNSRELYLTSVPMDVPMSRDARNALCKKYQEIKYTPSLQPSTRLNMLRGANQALYTFSKVSDIDSITGNAAVDFLTKERSVLTKGPMNALMSGIYIIIDALIEGNVVVDEGLSSAMKIRKQVNSFGFKMFKAIVQSEHPERWCVFKLTKYTHKDGIMIRYINAESECIRKLISEFFAFMSIHTSTVTLFCSDFQQSVAPHTVNCVDDFNYRTFETQTRYFSNKFIGYGEELVTSFYLYIHQNYDSTLFEKDNVSNVILTRQHIGREIAGGFEVVNYNPVESFPDADKWLLCYKKSARDTTVRTRTIDFTSIKCREHRDWIKGYIWGATPSIENRIHPFTIMRECCNRIYEFKTGELMSVFTSKNDDYSSISVREADALRNWILSSFDNNRTCNGYIYNYRNLLRFIEINNLGKIESGAYFTLTHSLDNSYDNVNPISDEELNAVSVVMKKKAEGNVLYGIYYSVFYIALETCFRSSQIVELTKDCVMETAKKGEYVLYSGTKTSAGEYIEQPITTYVEREIREILKLTEEYRQNCTDTSLANKLFIVPSKKHGVYRELSTYMFNAYFKRCCNEAGIPEYTFENLRDTHMTKAEEYVIRNSLSEVHQGVLSGHKHTSTDDIHYVRLGIREMLEAVHGVIIGNVSVDGKIIKEASSDLATTENEVSNGCGYCSSESCTNFSYLDCMLCKNFVTTVSRLPYFEEQLKVVDAKLPHTSVPHDKEDLVNIKILLLKYIEEILKIKEADTLGSE